MDKIFTIAARDLKSLFTSAKWGAIFFFFLIFMGVFFAQFLGTFIEMQSRAPMMGGEAPTLEQLLKALFYNLHFILILIIPAVTMATFSEERRNQAFRLLQTSPVTATQIVLGKFFATLGMLTMVLLASSVYPLFTIKYGNPDIGVILSSYLGMLLLISGQLAFGIWISSMTNNQFMAFLFTMAGLFFLLIVSWIGQSLGGTGITTDLLKYAASTEHLDVFFKGMLTVGDTAYFLCFAGMFLFFTNIVIDSQRWR